MQLVSQIGKGLTWGCLVGPINELWLVQLMNENEVKFIHEWSSGFYSAICGSLWPPKHKAKNCHNNNNTKQAVSVAWPKGQNNSPYTHLCTCMQLPAPGLGVVGALVCQI